MNVVLRKTERISQIFNSVVEIFTLALSGLLIAIVSMGIVSRYLFNYPLSWEQEASLLLFIWIAFLGASIVFYLGADVRILFVANILQGRLRTPVTLLQHLLPLLFFGIMFWKGTEIVRQTAPRNFQTLPISLGWMYLAAPISGLIMLLHGLKMFGRDLVSLSLAKGEGGTQG